MCPCRRCAADHPDRHRILPTAGLVTPHPFGPALRAIGDAGAAVEPDDQQLLARALFVYDALYAHSNTTSASR